MPRGCPFRWATHREYDPCENYLSSVFCLQASSFPSVRHRRMSAQACSPRRPASTAVSPKGRCLRYAIATGTGGGIITIGDGATATIGGTGGSSFTGAIITTAFIDGGERCVPAIPPTVAGVL